MRHARTPVVIAELLLATLVATAPRSASADAPLRRRWPLLEQLADATIAPPLPAPAAFRATVDRCLAAHYENPYTTLPPALAPVDQRVTTSVYPGGRFELRAAAVLPAPRAVTFELPAAPADARLEVGYRVFRCGRGAAGRALTLAVTVTDALGAVTTRAPLPGAFGPGPDEPRWGEVAVDLPVAEGAAFALTVAFEVEDGGGDVLVAWADPAVSGREPGVAARGVADTNVLWIIIDSARSDALGPRRAFASATPALDRVFAEGTSFTSAWSPSNQTRTSTAAMLASLHPSTGGYQSHDWALARRPFKGFLASRPPFVTTALARAGWRVAHIGDNDFLWATRASGGVDVGFPRVVDFRVDGDDARLASDAAARFIEAHRDERWFLTLGYLAPHTPYKPPPEWLAAAEALPGPARLGAHEHLPRSYVGELMWVDHNLARVLAALDTLGLAQDTLIVVTADHGEVMMPWHDCASERVKLRCGFNHSVTVYEDELNVPLALSWPGRVGAGRVVRGPVSLVDVAPTVLALLGVDADPRMSGRSLAAGLLGAAPLEPGVVMADGRLASAVRDGDWKLIVHAPDDDAGTRARFTEEGGRWGAEELFDLAADDGEQENLAFARPDVVARLRALLDAERARLAGRYWGSTTATGGGAARAGGR